MANIILKRTPKVPETEFSVPFVQGMLIRMEQSFFKYGAVANAQGKIDFLASAQQRIDKYKATGNTEFLMDAGNFIMIEFMFPAIAQAYFLPTTTEESPGRTFANGHVGPEANTSGQENMRLGGSHMRTDGGHYKHEGD